MAVDGVVLVDKPAGLTSHDVVAAVRRTLGGRGRGAPKVGHAGTLDPFATGLLLVLLGRATRIQPFLLMLPKSYVAVARLGWTSTTGDPEGKLLETGRIPVDPPPLRTGVVRQRPPAHSAVKIGGRRAYALARAGVEVEMPEREVRVDRFEQLWRDGERAAFAIDCSSGTYVRSLIADLGDAYCVELRRTAIGPFAVADAIAPPPRGATSLGAEPFRVGDALSAVLPTRILDEGEARRAGHGQVVELDDAFEQGPVVLVDGAGDAVCVADVTAGRAKPRVGFRA